MLKRKAAGSLEMLVPLYQTTLLHIPEDSNIDAHFIRISDLTTFL